MKNATNNESSSLLSTNHPALSKAEAIAWFCVFTLSSALIVAGNLLTIVIFAVNRRLHKKCFLLVVNMACADLMLGAVSLPMFIYREIGATYELWMVKKNTGVWIFHGIFSVLYLQASIIFAALISGERYFATHWPFKHRTLSTRAYRIVIFMAWIIVLFTSAILTALKIFISNLAYSSLWVSCTLTLTVTICFCNIAIWRKFRRGRIVSIQKERASQNRRLTKTLLCISLFALLSWLPIIIRNILKAVNVSLSNNVYFIAVLLNISSCFVNPIVYALRIPEFKEAITSLCCRRQVVTRDIDISERRIDRVSRDFTEVMDTKL